jgi:hypothetical protein
MPSIFKALASISAWVLFIFGLFVIAITLFMAIASGAVSPEAGAPPIQAYFAYAVGIASITLSVVVMKLRQMLE